MEPVMEPLGEEEGVVVWHWDTVKVGQADGVLLVEPVRLWVGVPLPVREMEGEGVGEGEVEGEAVTLVQWEGEVLMESVGELV